MLDQKLPIAVLISGGGTTLRNLLGKIAAGTLDVEIRLVISSSAQAKGLQFAVDAGIATQVIRLREASSEEAFSQSIFDACRAADVQLVALAGFLKRLVIQPDFVNRVTNIHPALIPAFCGHGFYGQRVHESALAYGVKVSGCTVHFVDNQYDHGPIIMQRVVPVLDDDTPHDLAARVFEAECEAYPQVLQWIAEGRVSIQGRTVRVRGGRDARSGLQPIVFGAYVAPATTRNRRNQDASLSGTYHPATTGVLHGRAPHPPAVAPTSIRRVLVA